jgi:hypothetical protein
MSLQKFVLILCFKLINSVQRLHERPRLRLDDNITIYLGEERCEYVTEFKWLNIELSGRLL